jgi:signal transduction histidine kinase
MKIRTHFRLLTAGILAAPILFFIIQALLWRLQTLGRDIPIYEEIAPYFNESINPDEWERIAKFIQFRLKPDTDICVLRNDFTVIYSTLDGFIPGENIEPAKILKSITMGNPRYAYRFESPEWIPGGTAFVLTRLDRQSSRPTPQGLIILTFIIISAFVAVFALAMSFFIARSITRSVLFLEAATRRLAEGELDAAVKIKSSNNEITSLGGYLNRMRIALKEEEGRRSRFIMGITHDLKTPLALMKGYAEAIEDGLTGDPALLARSTHIISAKADQLEGMIDELIDFVRVDGGQWRRNLQPVRIAALLGAYIKPLKDDAELLNRRVETRIDIPDHIVIPLDERLTLRALENLISNALRYTGNNGLLRIEAALRNNRIIIEISDNGPGIDETDLPHIFEIFYRGSSSRREQGMGLGLAVVKGIADSHGWELSAESEKGKGSLFRIVIPL